MIRRALMWLVVLAAPCALAQEAASSKARAPKTRPVRFLLTFDDGPYGQERDNPTESILDTLALHDGSTWGHRSHRNLSDRSLEKSVADGVTDLKPIVGRDVNLLRPPYWAYDARTLFYPA